MVIKLKSNILILFSKESWLIKLNIFPITLTDNFYILFNMLTYVIYNILIIFQYSEYSFIMFSLNFIFNYSIYIFIMLILSMRIMVLNEFYQKEYM